MSIVKLNNRGVRSVTSFGSATSGSMTFIKKLTASSSSTISFVDGSSDVVLDNTYKEYLFTFKNIHPQTDGKEFGFNLSADTGSNYNVQKTTTSFDAYNAEAGGDQGLRYDGNNNDLANGTGFMYFNYDAGNADDANLNGYMHLFNPSSTTFVKHFIASVNWQYLNTYSIQAHIAGYANTTSAIDAIQFKMESGNIDAGDICLYGIN
tara:strand:+ start:1198 stop:1818 length:621 start_codon:yes stop_codon:yes gene_type:complete